MWNRMPKAGKLAIGLVLSCGVIFAVFGAMNLRLQRRGAEELVLQSADRITDLIRRSTRYQMLHNDRAALYQMVRDIGSEPGIARIRIFNSEGRISFSTDPAEVGHVVDKNAESCYACHTRAEPLTKLDRPDRARIFPAGSKRRVLAVIRPIENEASCSDAACHAHPRSQTVLGVIDAQLQLDAVDAHASAQQSLLLRFSGGAIVLACLVSAIFIWIFLHFEQGMETKSRQLEKAQTYLEGSEKMASLGKLAATVAHEVNNPLFGILTYARLGLKALEPAATEPAAKEKAAESFRIIERESRRCGDIMRNLLTFARQTPSHRAPENLNELVSRAVELVRHQLDLQEITLETSFAPDLPQISCDAGQIQQVVLALLVNAAEAMPNGGGLWVITDLNGSTGQARLTVRDSGAGIPADILPNIFEPFFTTKEDVHRTGMGLAVAASILEQHGGSIEAQSRKGEGAEFAVRLPVAAHAIHE